jgi:putative intracellular protease/amidase
LSFLPADPGTRFCGVRVRLTFLNLLLLALFVPMPRLASAAGRPLVAVVADNEGTEITDFVIPYSVLRESAAADVVDVAVDAGPVHFMPATLGLSPSETLASFDARYPEGADYVIVPAMHRSGEPSLLDWLRAQSERGAVIVGICDGVWVLAKAGLLEGREATGHWYSFEDLEKEYPRTRWVRDLRYVRDGSVVTTTGVTASLPASLALVEEIAGRERAAAVARELGVTTWSAAHESARFRLDRGHAATAAGNWLALWRWERVGIPITPGIDEMALAFTADANARTYLSTAVGTAAAPGPVAGRRGLKLLPDATAPSADVDRVVDVPGDDVPPARALDDALARIAEKHGEGTARFVALQLEFPWPGSS